MCLWSVRWKVNKEDAENKTIKGYKIFGGFDTTNKTAKTLPCCLATRRVKKGKWEKAKPMTDGSVTPSNYYPGFHLYTNKKQLRENYPNSSLTLVYGRGIVAEGKQAMYDCAVVLELYVPLKGEKPPKTVSK